MAYVHDQLTWQFKQQLIQLELKMDSNTKQLFQDFDHCFQLVMQKIEDLVVNQNEMNIMIEA